MSNLNELQKDVLQSLLGNELLLDTVRKVFDEAIEKQKPQIRNIEDNALLGEKYRAYEQGKIMLKQGFADLMSYKSGKPLLKGFNKGK